jgi:PilZ domain
VTAHHPKDEKRDRRRRRVLKAGTITFDGSAIDCVVRNVSTTGAALEVESQLGIPPSFHLVIATELFSEHCRVLWRKEKRLGVVFDRHPSTHRAARLAPDLPDAVEAMINPLGTVLKRVD